MKLAILFRKDRETEEEYNIASKYFDVYPTRSKLPNNSLVIGRYSVLPFYKELEEDLHTFNSELIDSYERFRWIANFHYYEFLKDKTFKTWNDIRDVPDDSGPLVVKGTTNSKKGWWKEKMYCENKHDALLKGLELKNDSLFDGQDIIYRKYEPLVTYEVAINDLPITNEWRLFFYKNNLLTKGYYWTQADKPELGKINAEGLIFAQSVADIAMDHANFFVVDIAEKKSGGWILVELNSGQMSGLSLCDPEELYSNLKKVLS